MVNRGRGKLGRQAQLVLFLKSEGYNSTQIRYICVKILKIKGKKIYHKIMLYSKNIEIQDAIRRFENDNVAKKLRLKGLI